MFSNYYIRFKLYWRGINISIEQIKVLKNVNTSPKDLEVTFKDILNDNVFKFVPYDWLHTGWNDTSKIRKQNIFLVSELVHKNNLLNYQLIILEMFGFDSITNPVQEILNLKKLESL